MPDSPNDFKQKKGAASRGPGGNENTGGSIYPQQVKVFFITLLVIALALAFYIIFPFLHALIFAALLASISSPFYGWLTSSLRGKDNLAALILVALTFIIIVLPLFFFTISLLHQAVTSFQKLNEWIQSGAYEEILSNPYLREAMNWVNMQMDQLGLPKLANWNIKKELLEITSKLGNMAFSTVRGALGNVVAFTVDFFIMLFVMFYIVRDGSRLIQRIKEISPLPDAQNNRILQHIRTVARAVFLGSFLTALLQGFAGGIGFAIVSIPPLFWGALLGLASLIPIVGTALVWVPAVIYLLLIGSWKAAIFLAIWSILIVGSIDNFLRPFLVRGAPGFSPFYVFLAIIGGMHVFGLPGLIYGPLIFAFAAVLLFIYKDDFDPDQVGQEGT